MIDHLKRAELFRAEIVECGPVLLPLMTKPTPDTAERKRLELQAIPFALPKKREDRCP